MSLFLLKEKSMCSLNCYYVITLWSRRPWGVDKCRVKVRMAFNNGYILYRFFVNRAEQKIWLYGEPLLCFHILEPAERAEPLVLSEAFGHAHLARALPDCARP